MDALDLAQFFGVETLDVETWLARGMPTDPESAEAWLVDQGFAGYEPDEAEPAPKAKKSAGPSTKEEREKVKLELERLKLQEVRGEVLALDEVVAEMTRQHALAVQKLKGLTSLLIELLPADTPLLILNDFRARARKVISDACDDIATAFRGAGDDD
jgi:hypothetical protein